MSEKNKGNEKEDWEIFQKLCCGNMKQSDVDVTTSLRCELEALQYIRHRLITDLEELKRQIRSRDQKCFELQTEVNKLREVEERQNFTITNLRKRINDLEDRERELLCEQSRNEITIKSAQGDCRYQEDKTKELETRVRLLENDLNVEEKKKDEARLHLQDFIRRLSLALGVDIVDSSYGSAEALMVKASELIQETSRLRNRANKISNTLSNIEIEYRNSKENLDKSLTDVEVLQRQSASHLHEIETLRQAKESLEMHNRYIERELNEQKEKLLISNRSLRSANGNITQNETTIHQLKEELKLKDDKLQNIMSECRHTLESLSILLGIPSSSIVSMETSIRDKIQEILNENKDRKSQNELLQSQLNHETQQVSRLVVQNDQANSKIRLLEDKINVLELEIHKADAEVNTYKLIKDDSLKRNKNDSAKVYQLQKRIHTLREQIQRKDLHLELLRRKLTLQEDNVRVKCLLQNEKYEANMLVKKLSKQVDRLQLQLSEAKVEIKALNSQLFETAEYKILALERGRKIQELQKRLIDSEALRTKYNTKISLLKDQLQTTSHTYDDERNMSKQSMDLLRDEIKRLKDNFFDLQRREVQLHNFKNSILKVLGYSSALPDCEIISRMQKLVEAHHDFTLVSRRYDDPVLRLTARSPTGGSRCTRTPDRSRYDDSGYTDAVELDDINDDLL